MHFWSTDHSKCFTRAAAAMLCANLLIRNDTGLPIQSALQYFCAQPSTHLHTHQWNRHWEEFGVQYPAPGDFAMQGSNHRALPPEHSTLDDDAININYSVNQSTLIHNLMFHSKHYCGCRFVVWKSNLEAAVTCVKAV